MDCFELKLSWTWGLAGHIIVFISLYHYLNRSARAQHSHCTIYIPHLPGYLPWLAFGKPRLPRSTCSRATRSYSDASRKIGAHYRYCMTSPTYGMLTQGLPLLILTHPRPSEVLLLLYSYSSSSSPRIFSSCHLFLVALFTLPTSTNQPNA